jgi:hypothetical protein
MKKIFALLFLFVIMALIPSCNETEADPVDVSFTRTWTAVGDDGIIGQASQYDGRYALSQDSLNNCWDNCSQWIDSTTPLPSGQAESYTFTLSVEIGQTYYFAIKVADEVPNWSLISNIVTQYIPDDVSPSAVVDLN